MRPQRWQPTRLPHPWDSPGKNTGVGCHFLLQCMKLKSESEVAQLCPTLRDPMDCSLPGSSIHGIFQARVLEWGAIAFSRMWLVLSFSAQQPRASVLLWLYALFLWLVSYYHGFSITFLISLEIHVPLRLSKWSFHLIFPSSTHSAEFKAQFIFFPK